VAAASDADDAGTDSDASAVFDATYVHEVALSFDEAEYEAMIETYASTGEKEWTSATVTIDGTTYENAGIRLKGNSSLRGLGGSGGGPAGSASSDTPEELPWLIRLDKYVDGQNHEGVTDLVIRSNTSETSLNEAVALELLELAGLATEQAIAVSFSVNGSDATLRLAIEHPDDDWMTAYFDGDGALYKAESTGDYSYRGDDPEAYDEVFDQEAGEGNADLTPLIEFLAWLNESDDTTFAAELPDRLDVDAFAIYLAVQELIDNFDDIDGPGNNSYLYYDTGTGVFTVVAWDHNLAFGALGGGGGFPGGGRAVDDLAGGDLPALDDLPAGGPPAGGLPGGDRPARGDLQPPDGAAPFGELPEGGVPGGAGGPSMGNVLSERFLEVDEFQTLYEDKLAELTATLYDSGAAADVLASWVEVLGTTDLVDDATVQAEAARIAAYWEG
jgi:spore coat protein CotH